MSFKILVTGALGQIGSELVPALNKKFGAENVLATDWREVPREMAVYKQFRRLDVTDKNAVAKIISDYKINTIYHLAGILSAKGEQEPDAAWRINIDSLKNILDLAVKFKVFRLFWPSSIAVFGPTTPRENTPQTTILEPNTMYGITKVAGELLCQYYYLKHGLDVRSLRYPGIISWQTLPGGGTTDYASAIYYEALRRHRYECFVKEETVLPMIYMADAIRATLALMAAEPERIKVRTAYNLAGLSFSAQELAASVKKYRPDFICTFKPDARQNIADSWPKSVDDKAARTDWNWQPAYDLDKISRDMIKNLARKINGWPETPGV